MNHDNLPGLLLAALLCACGPAGIGVPATGGETGEPSTTAEPTTTGEPNTTGETTGWNFITDDIGCSLACDPFLQDCPEGEKCVPYASSGGTWDAFKCVPVLGDGALGETCTYDGAVIATDDCDATSHCWNVDGEGVGTCHAFCMGSPSNAVCPTDFHCLLSGTGIPSLCSRNCDPLTQDCNPGLACFWANGNFTCFLSTQNILTGEPCGYINDCAPGNICLSAEALPACEGSTCCGSYCNINLGDAQCDAVPGTVCVPFFGEGEARPGYEHVGLCVASEGP
jgi:hypothetical protein